MIRFFDGEGEHVKRTPIVLVVSLILCGASALARLGETFDQCETRYGIAEPIKATAPATTTYRFTSHGFLILIGFFEGRAHYLVFGKDVESEPLATYLDRKEFSETEITVLLDANKGTNTWKEIDHIAATRDWTRSDQRAVASYSRSQYIFMLASKEYVDRSAALRTAKEKVALSGF